MRHNNEEHPKQGPGLVEWPDHSDQTLRRSGLGILTRNRRNLRLNHRQIILYELTLVNLFQINCPALK